MINDHWKLGVFFCMKLQKLINCFIYIIIFNYYCEEYCSDLTVSSLEQL